MSYNDFNILVPHVVMSSDEPDPLDLLFDSIMMNENESQDGEVNILSDAETEKENSSLSPQNIAPSPASNAGDLLVSRN